MAVNDCPLCLEKQREIDTLKEEIRGLRAALRREQRKMEDGAFGSSTPSSKIPIKPNSRGEEKKPKGARPGHSGNGRKSHNAESADRIEEVQSDIELCPECGGPLEKKGIAKRSVLDMPSSKPEKVLFLVPRYYVWVTERSSFPAMR